MGEFDDLVKSSNTSSGSFDDLIPGTPLPTHEGILQKMLGNIQSPATRPLFGVQPDMVMNPLMSAARLGVSAAGIPEENLLPGIGAVGGQALTPVPVLNSVTAGGGAALGSALAEANKPLRGQTPDMWNPAREGAMTTGLSLLGEGAGAVAKPIVKVGKGMFNNVREAFQAPEQLAKVRTQLPHAETDLVSAKMNQETSTMPYSDQSKKGVSIANQATDSLVADLEKQKEGIVSGLRNKIVSQVGSVKQKTGKFIQDFYDTYGKILDNGEAEAITKGMTPEDYHANVIQPTLAKIEETGAQTPAAKRLLARFGTKEAEEGAKAVTKEPDIPQTLEQMKELKNSLGKYGQGDYIANMFHDLHAEHVGKYSDVVSKANQSYGQVKNSIKFANKTIVPHDADEITKTADLLQKEATGKLSETEAARLQVIKQGKNEFGGTGELLDTATKKAAKQADKEIADLQAKIDKYKSQNIEDVSTIKKASSESKYENKLTNAANQVLNKKNVLNKTKNLSQLKELQRSLEDKVKLRNRLFWEGAIGAGTILGVKGLVGGAKKASELAQG